MGGTTKSTVHTGAVLVFRLALIPEFMLLLSGQVDFVEICGTSLADGSVITEKIIP
jgi:hypothetical protein